jgi:hypothetical protein
MTVANRETVPNLSITRRVTRPGFGIDVTSQVDPPSAPRKVSGDEFAGYLGKLEGRSGETAGLTGTLNDDRVADSGIDQVGSSTDPASIVGEATAATGTALGDCPQLASWPRLNNAASLVQSHYRTFIPTTSHSAPVLRIGTLILAVSAAWIPPLASERQVLTFHTRAWSSFAPPACRMPLGQPSGNPRTDPGRRPSPRF